jgi:uncharacterized protein involved in type VI secretion and phage assembly
VRVASTLAPIAGANWGAVALPRPGQEVLLDFIEGNIDRPVIIGSLYNSAGNKDAPHTKGHYGAGVSTANAPAWFPGTAGANAHAAVLSGLKARRWQRVNGAPADTTSWCSTTAPASRACPCSAMRSRTRARMS